MRVQVIVDGIVMGTYEGDDEDEILDQYAEDAMYESYEQLLRETSEKDENVEVRECAIPKLNALQLSAVLAACGANNQVTQAGDVWIESMERRLGPDRQTVSCDIYHNLDEVLEEAEILIREGSTAKLG